MNNFQFVGGSCGNYGPYNFHRGFKFTKQDDQLKVIKLGDFFFVRISNGHDPCIGELELLWHDRNTDQRLSSVRLYFLPEQTPDGRLASHGQDEVLMASDKVVLRLEDLICWITDEVDWNHGLLAICSDDVQSPPPASDSLESETSTADATSNGTKDHPNCDSESQTPTASDEKPLSPSSVIASKNGNDQSKTEELRPTPTSDHEGASPPDILSDPSTPPADDRNEDDFELQNGVVDKNALRVIVLSYPNYCRYRTVAKRVEGVADQWLKNALVMALGGFTNCGKNTHILFCRDSFEHEELAHHELNCEYLAPTLKGKKKKKKGKNARCTSPGSESNTSVEEGKEIVLQNNVNNHNGFKQPPCKNEQEFLQRLFNFMKKRKTPIHRVPHLGFKQIDLFVFFSFAQKLGGYDKITTKRLWKHVYDELGGDPGSTSAATCTRRHYERLLLPFERFMDGKEYKPKQSRKQKSPRKIKEENTDITPQEDEKTDLVTMNGKTEPDDTYAFTDSNHENSKDSIANEDLQSVEDLQFSNENYSDEDSKSVWSIQKSGDLKEEVNENDENKQIKPLIIQKEQNESFSEKERKWNEIRRKNALARKWVRQLRPSRGSKSSSTPEDQNTAKQTSNQHALPNTFAPEEKASSENASSQNKTIPQIINNQHVKQEIQLSAKAEVNVTSECQEKLSTSSDHLNHKYSENGSYLLKNRDLHIDKAKYDLHKVKSEPVWPGYSRDVVKDLPSDKYPYDKTYTSAKNYISHEPKFLHRETKTPVHLSNLPECNTFYKSETDTSNDDVKPNLSQRRPSVIQHTEYVTSPSPSQSPKQLGPESYYESVSRESFNSNSNTSFKNQLSQNMAGKVSEWLAKGMPEAVACKTPSTALTEKLNECHDKASVPSTCKTPGLGSGKVPTLTSKIKSETYIYPSTTKPVKSKSHNHYKELVADTLKKSNPYYLSVDMMKNNYQYQAAFNPVTQVTNPIFKINPLRQDLKPSPQDKNRHCVESYYHQPSKRQRTTMTPVPLNIPPPPRPSSLPFIRQQTYRKAPHSDIPKVAPSSHNDYENSVLDLSIKKKSPEKPVQVKPITNMIIGSPSSDAVCLDLSIKKKPNRDNATENITPPITPSPKPVHHYSSSYSSPRSSRPPALITLQDIKKEESRQKIPSTGNSIKPNGVPYNNPTAQTSIPLSSLAMSSNSVMFPGNAQNKLSSNFIASLPDPAFSKDITKTLYLPPDPMRFSPYVIPPLYAPNWTSPNTASNANLSSNSTTSPNAYKETINHGVFPKQYLYNYKNQFHPLLCKENGYYPPSCK